uniref:Zeta toxin domain-containing protein n=1 Tax=Brassica campestris TaxID=3711 RepID=M4DYQ9_BRACM
MVKTTRTSGVIGLKSYFSTVQQHVEKADTLSPNTKQTQTPLVPILRVLPILNLMSLDDPQTESIHMLNRSSMCVPEFKSNNDKTTFSQILLITSIGLLLALALHYRLRKIRHSKNIPRLRRSHKHKGHEKLERFSHYVVRQMGFKDRRECPHLCKLANEYIRKSGCCEEDIYSFFSEEPDADSLFIKLVEEFERCILSYFAYHWSHADLMISQILSADVEPKKKLKHIVMAATRDQRFERVTKNLKVARVFNTLVEEMKAMGIASVDDSECTEVMAPVAHKDRSPVLLLMGGGMGAGKSTVLKEILKEPFWAGADAVVIEADAFKESDVIYRALSSRGHADMIKTAEFVHQSSTDAASSLLVTALNEGRDVIMDGTLSWVPFVVQTITMTRNVHRHRYRMGAGYKVGENGDVIENYWERIGERQQLQEDGKERKPYRIELVGVVCDAYLAVIRGIRRAIMCRRAVRVRSQLTSHKRFADAFLTYCNIVDNARLYCTNALEGSPKMIAWKEKEKTLLVDPEEIDCLKNVGRVNENAESIYELYRRPNPACEAGSIWKDIVLSPSRFNIQQELKYSIQKVERFKQCLQDTPKSETEQSDVLSS